MDRRIDNTLIMCGIFFCALFYLAFLWGAIIIKYPVDLWLPVRYALHPDQYVGQIGVVGYSAVAVGSLGLWAGWEAGKPPAMERHKTGPRLTASAAVVRTSLARDGKLDGITLAPGLPISRQREMQHICLFGETGGGKTQIMVPWISQAIARGDKVIIYDFKGDLERFLQPGTATLFAPWFADADAWDIGADVINKEHANWFAASVIPDGQGKDGFFYTAARAVLAAIVNNLQVDHGKNWGFAELIAAASQPLASIHAALVETGQMAAGAINPHDRSSAAVFSVFSAYVERLTTLGAAWSLPGQRKVSVRDFMVRAPDGSTRDRVLILGGNTSYVISETYISIIIGVISAMMGDTQLPTQDNRAWLFLDEFQELGRIPKLETIFAVTRSKGVRAVLASQDPGRLEQIYQPGIWQSIFANCETKIFAKTGGAAKKEFSELIGNAEVERLTQTYSGNGQDPGSRSWGYQPVSRPVFAPDRFGTDLGIFRLGKKKIIRALVYTGREQVGLLTWPITPYHQHPIQHLPADWTFPGHHLHPKPIPPMGDPV